ncbi:MAG: aspartate--tRNA ligase, partial [Armatimonadota bacterium]|nr:aspartate--tRNA ligase [Armatimonadota bacterium]
MKRTHSCGTLNESHIGQEVTLCGWANVVRDQAHQMFIDLRDRSGLIQCVVDRDVSPDVHEFLTGIKAEYCLQLAGTVQRRLPGKENPKIATGAIEVHIQAGEILNPSKTPPFEIVDDVKADENVRLQYRYLDLRRPLMQSRLELRHRVAKSTRDFLDSEGFWEIETPLLWKSTPEGAKEFVVPSAAHTGRAFVLPQSPQICKQLLMVAGIEKYFQIARCFRDETARADRFLEFTQIDLEMSFVEQDDILSLWERMFQHIMREVAGVDIKLPLPRLTYAESLRRYGTDKPDTRFGMELVDLSDLAVGSSFKVFANAVASGGQVKAINAPGCAAYSRKEIEELTELVKRLGARGLATFALGESEIKSQVAKFFTEEQMREIFMRCGAQTGDLVLCVADQSSVVAQSLDFLRREMAKRLNLIPANTFNFLWLVDTPLFEFSPTEGRFDAMHHPFCLPNPEDLPLLEEGFTSHLPLGNPGHPWARVRSWLYDLVLNGWEISSGSIRCHRRDLQEKV